MSACGVSWCGLPYGKDVVPVSALLSPVATSKWAPAFCSRGCLDRATVGAVAVDREACLWFCGMTVGAIDAGSDRIKGIKQWFPRSIGDDGPRWCSPECRATAFSPLEAKPAAPPSPAPGQRWMEPHGRYHFDVTEILTIDGQRIIVATSPEYKSPQWLSGSFDGYRYIGPTPATPTPSAAASLPSHAPGAAALGSRPPEGYGPCPKKCGRWTYQNGASDPCWTCYGVLDGGAKERFPDWTPPARKPTRVPGITCRHCLLTSAGGNDHMPTCVVMRERGPSAVASASGVQRDRFADLADEWDLLPDGGR